MFAWHQYCHSKCRATKQTEGHARTSFKVVRQQVFAGQAHRLDFGRRRVLLGALAAEEQTKSAIGVQCQKESTKGVPWKLLCLPQPALFCASTRQVGHAWAHTGLTPCMLVDEPTACSCITVSRTRLSM